ncbi:NEAT domain-containing protein [Clostridium sp. LP20]|uniref:NEAT domain-containing protein n=1 Tax=Clostridium sp. LP20 TaxID=3418665 RepID=UPI003EE4B94F
MLKNKIKKFLAVALVLAATMNVGGNIVHATVLSNEGSTVEFRAQSLKDGEYEVKNITSYLDPSNTTGQEMARNSVKETSKLIVKDGVISMTVYFNETLFPMMGNFNVSLNGTELKGTVDNATKSINYTIPSIDAKVLMSMKVVVMGRDVSFNLSNNLETLTLIKEYETEEKVQNGDYTIKNDVKYIGSGNAETGNASARKTLKDVSNINVKDGKYTLTLNFDENQFKFIGDVKVNVDGNEGVVNISKETAKVSLEIPSLDSKIEVGVFVTMMNRYTNFETILLQDTLTKVDSSDDEVTGPSTGGSDSGNGSNGSNGGSGNTSGGTTNGTISEVNTEPEVVVVEGKLYTIKNKVTHSNPTGQAMARQYLNESSSLEEIEGKYYLTLTFTGMDYMSNHKFTIDGKEVSARATKVDDKTTKYRFQIPSLDATISVSTYVAPMGRNVDFDVTLLKDTKTFVKEFTVEKLPQTGGVLGSNLLLGMGTVMLGAAGVLKRKNK